MKTRLTLPAGTRELVKKYLLFVLTSEDPTRFKENTLAEIRRVALAEKFTNANEQRWYNFNAKAAIRDWFQGLGMSVAFTYYDIARKMRVWGYEVNEDDDDDYYDKCDLYWDILAKVVYEAK